MMCENTADRLLGGGNAGVKEHGLQNKASYCEYCVFTSFALMQIINAFRAPVSSCIKMRAMVATYEVFVSAQHSFWHTKDTQ